MLCPHSVEIWTDCGFSDVQEMCHKVGLDNISKILATLVDEAGILAPLIMWNIWISRNKFIFEGTTHVKYQIITSIFTQLHVSKQAFESPTSHSHRAIREVCWNKGDEDAMILNVDGSALTNPGKAGFGGLVRNHDGTFQFGFYGSVGLSNIFHAEIQALLVGIRLCWQAGYRQVMCFSNSLHVVQLVIEGTSQFHHYSNELEIIKDFMAKDWTISLHNTLREGNACADVLAKLGAINVDPLIMLQMPPSSLSLALLADALGVSFVTM